MADRVGSLRRTDSVAFEGIADIRRSLAARRSDANDPQATCCKPLFDHLRGGHEQRLRDRDAERLGGLVFHPTALPAGKVSLICCARKSCQCGRADVHFSGSHYADGRHLTSDQFVGFSPHTQRLSHVRGPEHASNRSSPYESTHQDSGRADDRCCPWRRQSQHLIMLKQKPRRPTGSPKSWSCKTKRPS